MSAAAPNWPAGNSEPEYLGDGAYASHDSYQVWVSCMRDGPDGGETMHAVALEAPALLQLIRYAKRIGLIGDQP